MALLAIYWKETKYEFWKYLRLPLYCLLTIFFPVMFYVLFGLLMNRDGHMGGTSVCAYLIASYGTYGVMGAALYANGVGVATERGLGWLQVKRASPMPPSAYFAAKFAVSMIFSAASVLTLLTLGTLFGGVHFAMATAVQLVLTLVVGAIPFCAMGLVIGCFAGPNSAAAMVNMIYIPLSFASGVFFPIEKLPKFVQSLAPVLPPYHLAQLALGLVGAAKTGPCWPHWQVLIGCTLICLGVAWLGFQRDQGKMYG
jgi:ABC-2 type transport system permease protein